MTGPMQARPDLGQHLALVASVLRDLAGGAHWDAPGIRAEIHRAKHLATPVELTHAVIAWCTSRPDLRAPIGLADDGPHWHTGRTPAARVARVRCAVVGHEYEDAHSCRLCPTEQYAPHDIPTLTLSEDQVARNILGARMVRDAITPHHPSTDGRNTR